MKLWLKLLVILIVCLVSIAVPSAPAQAQVGCPGFRDIDITPSSGVPGTNVTVYGDGFTAGRLVDIYYDGNLIATGRTTLGGDFTISFIIPEGHRGFYEVKADLGYTTAETVFAVEPGLTISPEKGHPGTNVTVQGWGFAKNEQDIGLKYYLNGNYETVGKNIVANDRGSWQRSFQIPAHASGVLKLDAEGPISRLHLVNDAFFTVTGDISLDKSTGIVGDTITMTGSRFAPRERNIEILFAGQAVATGITADAAGYWQASFTVPEMPTGEYNITAEGEHTRKADVGMAGFQIVPHMVLSPDEGHVAADVTVTGRGFVAGQIVAIKYDGSQKASVRANDKGSFETSFVVPQSQHGQRLVTAWQGGENHASAIFIMESVPPPIPTLLSPAEGSRLGFIRRAMPTFEWSAVSDDSGVRYNLQIATSAVVTATGEFVDPIFSKEGLVATSYTMDEVEAVAYGTYYWIVQAVDGADNESGWAEASSFRVGLLPVWVFIVAIIVAVSLLAIGIRALVVKRSILYERW